MTDYGMWSFHIPSATAFRAAPPPSQSASPAPLNDDDDDDDGQRHSAAPTSAAESPLFDARSLVVKREPAPAPPPPPQTGADDVHRGTMLRRATGGAGSTFGFVDNTDDVHQQQALPPGAAAVYHPFHPSVTLSPRLWTSESVADEYGAAVSGPRMSWCGAGTLTECRPLPTATVNSDDRSSSTPPSARPQPINVPDPNSSNLRIGERRTHNTIIIIIITLRFIMRLQVYI